MTVKLRYHETIAVNPTSGAASAIAFRANSCYDPYVPAGGHQPKGLDQYFALYDKAVVTSSKCVLKCVTGAAGEFGIFGVSLRNDATTETAILPYAEDPTCVWAMMGNVSTANQECVSSYERSWFGTREAAVDDEELHFTSSFDAGKVAYYHCWYGPTNSSLDAPAASMIAFIEYTITFFEPNTLPVS